MSFCSFPICIFFSLSHPQQPSANAKTITTYTRLQLKMNIKHISAATQPRANDLWVVTCEDGSICLVSPEQIKSWNTSMLQQASRITAWDVSADYFVFAGQPPHAQSNMSLQGARAAGKQALRRSHATSGTNSIEHFISTASTRSASRRSIPTQTAQIRPKSPSSPPPYTVGSYRQAAAPNEDGEIVTQHGPDLWTCSSVLLFVFIALVVCKIYFAQEPATHTSLGRLLMDGMCRDVSLRRRMELVNDGSIRRSKWW